MTKPKYKSVTIEVTEHDIELAIPSDSGHCAIADAIQRQIPSATKVSVDLQTIRWSDRAKGERYVYLTPRVAQALLLDFDQGERDYCQPLTFQLRTPAQVLNIRSFGGAAAKLAREQKKAENAQKRAAIEAKVIAGDELTSTERRQLAAYRNNEAVAAARAAERAEMGERPTSAGPRVVESVDPVTDTAVVTGGEAPVVGALAHGQGKVRRFGIKSAGSPKSSAD